MLPVMPALATLAALGWQQLFAQQINQDKKFVFLCMLALAIAAVGSVAAVRMTQKNSSKDAAQRFACLANSDDTVYAVGDFPYDFPFYAGAVKPMVVLQDWPQLRKSSKDNWHRELLEGVAFDPVSAQVLQTYDQLKAAASRANNWVVAPSSYTIEGFSIVYLGKAWSLYQSQPLLVVPLSAKNPKSAENKSLSGCKNYGN